MYADQLREEVIPIENICLDPNNPRFWTEKAAKDVPDAKIADDDVQVRAMQSIETHGIQELSDSMMRNGFLPLDRVVVRAIKGIAGKYVVVEGNRRIAALKKLRTQINDGLVDEERIPEGYLEKLFQDTAKIRVLVYEGTDTKDIAWRLQGIRHISGIKEWQPAQRAKLLADQIDKEGFKFREAGQQFGLTAQAVGRLYRAYKALDQMRNDDEYQSLARNDYFTLFEEAIRNKDVKQWLDWDEDAAKFNASDNLQQFYSWISPDGDDGEKRRRIHDPRQIGKLGVLVAGEHAGLLSQIDQHQLTIDGAYDRVTQVGEKYNWRHAIEKASELISDIPQKAIASDPDAFIGKLDELIANLNKLRLMALASKGEAV